ncbi:MAG: phage baseplate assembly protein V [Beijerinckiaceae bacterium]|nr:phage baseplate assembly protein V [Beijerinckiaceae bacterium]
MKSPFNQSKLLMELDGQPAAPKLAQLIAEVLVRQELGAPAVAEITFTLLEPTGVDSLKIGKTLAVRIGRATDTLFEGEISSISYEYGAAGVPVLKVRAYDKLQRLRRSFRPRAFEKISAADLAAQLAGELGIDSACHGQPQPRDYVLQHEQSDFDLLADLAEDAGLYPVINAGALTLTGLDGFGDALEMRFGAALLAFSGTLSNERNVRGATAAGWSPASAAAFSETVTVSRQDAYEARDVSPDEGASGYRPMLNRIEERAAQVAELAQAGFDRDVARSIRASGEAVGNVALTPGRPITVTGVADEVAGRHVVTSALHRINAARGYVTEFATDSPRRASRRRTPLVTLGVVTDTLDPDHKGRCRVQLPALGDTLAPWLPTLIAGAGSGKGAAVFPEAGDTVLLLCPDGDPAHGVVLGGLYGEKDLPRGFSNARPRPFVLRTANGQRLELSSTSATARLATASGSLLELMPGQARLAAASDLIIEAPGKTITFRASFINFERI